MDVSMAFPSPIINCVANGDRADHMEPVVAVAGGVSVPVLGVEIRGFVVPRAAALNALGGMARACRE